MDNKKAFVHPYLPNSVPEIKKEMLDEIGVSSIEDIYKSIIPDDLLCKGRLDLPEAIMSEYEVKKHVSSIMNKNITTEAYSGFLGAGCYRHQVPAICDEINMRGEFLTAYCGDTYSDHGKMQAIFEYASQLAELLDTDVVSYTTYDSLQSVVSAFRTAGRYQYAEGRKQAKTILIPSTMSPEILSAAKVYCKGVLELVPVKASENGCMCLKDLEEKLKKDDAAAVFYENPSYLGFFEAGAAKIAELAHAHKALVIAMPDVASLGIVESPANMGADLLVGDIQPLGMHIQFGGGQAGFMACRHDISLLKQLPTYMYGICKTQEDGKYGWGRAMNYRCSHGSRENANEYFGTEAGLWAITAGIYMACMGPQGMYELGETILQKTAFAVKTLSTVPGLKVNLFGGKNFQEFVVNYDGIGKTAAEVNKALLEKKIFGGKDISGDFPEYGQSGLYCISELTTEGEILALKAALDDIARGC